MSGATIARITTGCIVGGTLLGLALRKIVPDLWLTMLYMSFGLFAPRNATVLSMMFIGALSLATALFLITEMNHPMGGAIKVSSASLRKALEHLGN